EEGNLLVNLARESISCCFNNKNPNISKVEKFSDNQGVFVTLTKNNQLRGCIGFPEPVFPLYKAVIKAATAAAFEDPRFPPLQKQEFKDISIEISVLTVPRLIKVNNPEDYLKKIKIGRDGLIIRSGLGSGLLLPQVATEYKWDVKTFLENLCQKAWLSSDAWKDITNKLYKFQAQIFRE
ncbi:MAG: TIGR00296 family protein, partial [Candidatus Nanoarchaeia archaeon]|nr:TIGR00296 family protein [Candidatus Nanoarchaeia archaeon]